VSNFLPGIKTFEHNKTFLLQRKMFKGSGGYNSVPEVEGVELSDASKVTNPLSEEAEPEMAEVENIPQGKKLSTGQSSGCYEEIRVLDIKGRTYKMKNVPLDGTVGDLKLLIEEETGVPIHVQRLIYGGRQLNEDGTSLERARVKNNTVIHVFQRPAQGGSGSGGNAPLATASPLDNVSPATTAQPATAVIDIGNVFEPELQEYRRRVKLLAIMLFFVSTLNLVRIYTFSLLFFFFFFFLFLFVKHFCKRWKKNVIVHFIILLFSLSISISSTPSLPLSL
jgi:hypothetical protein